MIKTNKLNKKNTLIGLQEQSNESGFHGYNPFYKQVNDTISLKIFKEKIINILKKIQINLSKGGI